MKNAIIECRVENPQGKEETFTFTTDGHMQEFFIFNEGYQLIDARKIVLLQTYNKEKEEFEWV